MKFAKTKKTKKSLEKLQTYTVWTEQVNADMFSIRARSAADAIKKTKAEWKKDWAHPVITYVENEAGERVGRDEE